MPSKYLVYAAKFLSVLFAPFLEQMSRFGVDVAAEVGCFHLSERDKDAFLFGRR